jgi:hypothetical protein
MVVKQIRIATAEKGRTRKACQRLTLLTMRNIDAT